MAKGELVVEDETDTPALVDNWLIDRKLYEIRKWLHDNFVDEGSADVDFSEWDNSDELEESTELSARSTRLILMERFGHRLTAVEFEKIHAELQAEDGNDWVPSGSRIDVEEIEDDDDDEPIFESFSQAKQKIPELLRYLEDVAVAFHPHLGHNHPPQGLQITASEIEELKRLLRAAEELPDNAPEIEPGFITNLGIKIYNVGKEVIRYLGAKGDIFVDKFLASAGDSAGKWAVKALPLLYAGHLLRDFGDGLLKLVAGQ